MAISLDCTACKSEKTMAPTKIPRFNLIIRLIGIFIVTPSLLGVVISFFLFFSTIYASSEMLTSVQSDAEAAGAAIGAGVGYGVSIFLGIGSLVGGLIGWLLLMKRKVYKCLKCGFFLDRA